MIKIATKKGGKGHHVKQGEASVYLLGGWLRKGSLIKSSIMCNFRIIAVAWMLLPIRIPVL